VTQSAQPAKAVAEVIADATTPARKVVLLPSQFVMRRGGSLPEVHIAFETWGRLSPGRDNAILLLTGLSPSAHAASSPEDPTPGWWEYMVGPGKPIDTGRFYVICVNSLGGCHGSTGPGSVDPRTGARYNLTFPELTVEDIATAARETVRALGIARLHAVVGASLGGMAALAYAIQYPNEVASLVAISAAARALPFAIAIRALQREVIRSDPAWNGGNYPAGVEPTEGMRLARKLGLVSYRSAEEWTHRFGRDRVAKGDNQQTPFGIEFEIESYLEHQARTFIGSFDANSYLYLSRAMDWFDVAEHGGSVDAGLSRIRATSTLVVGVESDILFPLHQQQEIVDVMRKMGRDVAFSALPSVQGHDAFLVDAERFAAVVSQFFAPV
jgi:homoserine O-acetyltransferase